MKYLIGITDEITECENCGRHGLKRTAVLSDENGNIVYFGVDCAAQALYHKKSSSLYQVIKDNGSRLNRAKKVLENSKKNGTLTHQKLIDVAVYIGGDTQNGKIFFWIEGKKYIFFDPEK